MRFAYIDSQGKEVGIPTVDALQLRIELGAIGESTMFYDAGADKWAPAGDHEIFATLSRELKERQEGTFVAPPPPAAGRSPGGGAASPAGPGPRSEDAKPRTPDPFRTGPESDAEGDGNADGDELDPFDPAGFETLEPGGLRDYEEREAEEPAPARSGDDVGFDFGDLQGLELAGGLDQIGAEADGGPADEPSDVKGSEEAGDSETEPGGAGVTPPDGDLELEQSFAEQHAAEGSGVDAEPLELEGRLADYGDEAPSWLQDDADDHGGDASGDWAAIAADPAGETNAAHTRAPGPDAARAGEGEDGGGRQYERRAPRPRPSPPPRRKKRRSVLPLVLVAVVALAAAGWYGWNALQGGDGAGDDGLQTQVVLPPIDPALEPRMREVARQAYLGMLDEMRAVVEGHELPEEPNAEWLSGNYLGNASEFEDIQDYWLGFRDALAHVRSSEDEIFAAHLGPLLDLPELDGEERDQIRERALAGFEAAAPDRRQVYEQFRALTAAALDLHTYLLDNEENIDYTPAAGGLSRDPVVEAVPITPELGEDMWARVGRIPDALDQLGALEKVTTPRLVDLLVQKLDATPIR